MQCVPCHPVADVPIHLDCLHVYCQTAVGRLYPTNPRSAEMERLLFGITVAEVATVPVMLVLLYCQIKRQNDEDKAAKGAKTA